MKIESLRRDSFESSVHPLDGESWKPWLIDLDNAPLTFTCLASHGFYYFGVTQIVRCAYCEQQFNVKDWTDDTDITREHKLVNPLCPFVNMSDSVDNITIRVEYETLLRAKNVFDSGYAFRPSQTPFPTQTLKHMNIYMRTFFANPDMIKAEARSITFTRGWLGAKSSINQLVDAGFYFIGPSTCVACYLCGVMVKSFQSHHNPYEAHVYFSPKCTHIMLVKGPMFHETVQAAVAERLLQLMNESVTDTEPNWYLSRKSNNAFAKNFDTEQTISNACCICLGKKANIIVFPCNHVSTCGHCTANLLHCPKCKHTIFSFSWARIVK